MLSLIQEEYQDLEIAENLSLGKEDLNALVYDKKLDPQDIFDEDFSQYLFLGNNNLTSTINSCSGNTTNYTITNNSNGYTSEIKQGTNSLYKFVYTCQ